MTRRSRRFRRGPSGRIRPIRNWDAAQNHPSAWPGSARAEPRTELDDEPFEPNAPADAPEGYDPSETGPRTHRPSSPAWDGRPVGMGAWAHEPRDAWPDDAARGWENDASYPHRGHPWPGVPHEGVRLGYQVVEDHIRRGERASQHFAEQAMGSMRTGDGLWELFLRIVQASGPIAAAGSQFLDALARLGRPPSHFGPQPFEPDWHPGHWPEHEAYGPYDAPEPDMPPGWSESAAGMAGYPDDLATTDEEDIRLRVRLDVEPPVILELCLETWAQNTEISVQELVSEEASLPSLRGIELDTQDGWLDVKLRLPESSTTGVYTGTVLESSSGEPCGQLTARVGDATPPQEPRREPLNTSPKDLLDEPEA